MFLILGRLLIRWRIKAKVDLVAIIAKRVQMNQHLTRRWRRAAVRFSRYF